MGRQPPILQILGAASGCGASLSKFKLLVCLLKLQRFLLVWWDLTRSPVLCADGDTLWQQHGEQRRRVEVLRSVHRTTRAVIGEKRLKSHPDVASWKSTVFFCLLLFAAEWSCIEVQTRVAGQGSERRASQIGGISHMEIILVSLGLVFWMARETMDDHQRIKHVC
jgi:hypothetical protein